MRIALALVTLAACGSTPPPQQQVAPADTRPPLSQVAPIEPADAQPRPAPEPQDPQPVPNDPAKAPKANAPGCKADVAHCCRADNSIDWLNGCCGGALPRYCGRISGHGGERGADGRCEPCARKCLPADAAIATPAGDRAVSSLAVGDPVWTVGRMGERRASRVARVTSLPIETAAHELVVVRLDDGRRVRASAGHPTTTAPRLDALRPGDRLDGARVISVERQPYRGGATWDLLPEGGTAYWADGVLLDSTLR